MFTTQTSLVAEGMAGAAGKDGAAGAGPFAGGLGGDGAAVAGWS
jgi:hypothetical protein